MRLPRALVCLLALIPMTGCAAPSTAYVVNGVSVSEGRISEAAEACATLTGQQPTSIRASMMNSVLAGTIGDQIASGAGITITDEQRRILLDSSEQGRLMQRNAGCSQVAGGLATYLLVLDQLGDASFGQALAALDVRVNPRYGRWDPAQGVATGSASLSELDLSRS